MSKWSATIGTVIAILIALAGGATASKLNTDPLVIYTEEFSPRKLYLKVVAAYPVYDSKTGGKRLGVTRLGARAQLIGITDRALQVSVMARHGQVAGWVHPKAFTSDPPEFLTEFKNIYRREMAVRKLISAGQVALGMNQEEVVLSLGEPVKRSARITADGRTSSWEFITYQDVDHYDYIRDPFTGQVFRRFSHTTREISSQIKVDFTNGLVTALEESEERQVSLVRTVPPPIFIPW